LQVTQLTLNVCLIATIYKQPVILLQLFLVLKL